MVAARLPTRNTGLPCHDGYRAGNPGLWTWIGVGRNGSMAAPASAAVSHSRPCREPTKKPSPASEWRLVTRLLGQGLRMPPPRHASGIRPRRSSSRLTRRRCRAPTRATVTARACMTVTSNSRPSAAAWAGSGRRGSAGGTRLKRANQIITVPPSTMTVCPVMKALASDRRKITAPVRSAGICWR